MAIKTTHQTNITLKGSHDASESLTFEVNDGESAVVRATEQDRTVHLLFTRQELVELIAALADAGIRS